jgi:phosphohistidine phosphatase SixA
MIKTLLLLSVLTLALLAGAPARAAEPASAAPPAPASAAEFVEKLATPAQLQQWRQGGFVLYLRHGSTDSSRPDRTPSVDLADCSTQRPLSEAGRRMMAQVGEAIRLARLPLADIHASPMCRAAESARLAFGAQMHIEPGLVYSANMTTAQKVPILATTARLLSTPVPQGNRVLVAHGPNLMDLIGYFPAEGTLAVFEPLGSGGYRYVASIPAGHWAHLQHRGP